MTFESIIYEVKDSLAYITLNRPKALNALNQQVLTELDKAIDMIQNNTAVKAVIVTGSGEKAFAAGADITELQKLDSVGAAKQSEFGNAIFSKLSQLPQPVIAAVNGFALGGGMELALACDIRFASTNAKLGLPEVGLGIMPGYGGTQRLARLIGLGRAKQLVFAAETINAEEAYRLGIINKVVEPETLIEEVEKFVSKMLSKSAAGVQMAKKTMDRGYDIPLENALAYEAANFGTLFSNADQEEGMTAFLEKRAADFK
ncbi:MULTISPECIES: enoyl-CoA hydratase-related protein [unclassified Jeotgalibaca]|uniref:enoyl-CoA hydratase-related protein n=1 Tax=unclassified Jeotgalibaca TaxID=2621505 RepID=UPI003FCFAE76